MFDCPKCSHSKCIEVRLKRTQSKAFLHCRVCRVKYETKIKPLMKEVYVFCKWKDMLDEQDELIKAG